MSSNDRAAAQVLSAIAGFRLVTADFSRLRHFYRDVLGFEPAGPEHDIRGEEITLLGLHGRGRRQALRLGDQIIAIEQFDPPGRPCPAEVNAASLSFQHLALVVTDIASAYHRVRVATAISECGPQHLPASSGDVEAYKFRDPDGHPLELLRFPDAGCPVTWRGKIAAGMQIGLGIDHSAISVAEGDASAAFYGALGLKPGDGSFDQGPEQQRLDNLQDVRVTVSPMHAATGTPHLELLCYQVPRGAGGQALRANDLAATRIVWRGTRGELLRDPDGHLQQIVTADQELPQ